MNYEKLADLYKPDIIQTLLIGEAPPPNGKNYFYKVPEKYPSRNNSIEDDASLPATIFNHYFGRRPNDAKEYEHFLQCLKERGIFLIDIINEPLEIKKKDKSLNQENIGTLVSESNLKDLSERVKKLPVTNETKIIFLMARKIYQKRLKDGIKNKFHTEPTYISWKDFRMNTKDAVQIN